MGSKEGQNRFWRWRRCVDGSEEMDLASLTRSLRTDTGGEDDTLSGFYVVVNGQVELGDLKGTDRLYCKYDFTYGSYWEIIQGVDKGISQIAAKMEGEDTSVVWNFPIDISFKATNAYGWPRLVVSVFGIDALGRDVAKGYGSVLIPTKSGRYERFIRVFTPISSSYFQQFISWIRGTRPEFYDSRFVSKSQGREVTRVQSVGVVKVQLNVTTRGMKSQGYEAESMSALRSPLSSPTARARKKDPHSKAPNSSNSALDSSAARERMPLSPMN